MGNAVVSPLCDRQHIFPSSKTSWSGHVCRGLIAGFLLQYQFCRDGSSSPAFPRASSSAGGGAHHHRLHPTLDCSQPWVEHSCYPLCNCSCYQRAAPRQCFLRSPLGQGQDSNGEAKKREKREICKRDSKKKVTRQS